jgi:hypothetical protein
MNQPSHPEILECCAKLLGEELMWVPEKKILLNPNEVPQTIPIIVRLGVNDPWDPVFFSAQAFELQIILDAQIRIDHQTMRVFAVSGEDYAGVGIPDLSKIFDQARLAVALLAYAMWHKYKMPLKEIRQLQAAVAPQNTEDEEDDERTKH